MSSTLIVEVCTIEEIIKHPNADKVELVRVKNWIAIAGIGQFKVGDKCVYLPPDCVISEQLAERWGISKYCPLLPRGIDGQRPPGCRIKAQRFRGERSFGTVQKVDDETWPVGMSVVDHYGISKYEPPMRCTDGDSAPPIHTFHTYTSIENINNFPNVIQYGEEVVISEKLHGCLQAKTMITMHDGSKKHISKIQIGDHVVGVDQQGLITTTKVTNVFNNGITQNWMYVKTSRDGVGAGNHFAKVISTPNHRFWNPMEKKYVEAKNLQPGDTVLVVRNEIGLTPIQEQVILGKLLGDGSLHMTDYAASLIYRHKKESQYAEWTNTALGEIGLGTVRCADSGYGTEMTSGLTRFLHCIKRKFESFYINGAKSVPDWVAGALGPIALAFWYMDDGSLGHHPGQEDRALFASGFSEDDCNVLTRGLLRFGIKAIIYQSDNYWRIRLNADDAEKLFLLIAPYIPAEMQYKLPKRYRGHIGWIPQAKNSYKPLVVWQVVLEVGAQDLQKKSKTRYDIETETHNFFANGVLVHNSNMRVGYVLHPHEETGVAEWQWVAGSHGQRRKEFNSKGVRSMYWLPFKTEGADPIKDMLHDIKDHTAAKQSVVVYGEIFGPTVQDMHYGQKELTYRVFDIAVDGKYLDFDTMKSYCEAYGVPMVPYLYRGPFSLKIVGEMTDGPTTICDPADAGKFKGREGVVVRPVKERYSPNLPNCGRVVLKSISVDYYERKNGTEYH